jgi:hypothetical protein
MGDPGLEGEPKQRTSALKDSLEYGKVVTD